MQKSSVKLCSFFSIALNSTCTAIDTWSLVPLFHTTCVTSYIIVFYGNRNCNQIVCERFKCGKAAATIKKTPSYGSNWCNNNNNKLDGLDRVGEHHMNGATVAATIITAAAINSDSSDTYYFCYCYYLRAYITNSVCKDFGAPQIKKIFVDLYILLEK